MIQILLCMNLLMSVFTTQADSKRDMVVNIKQIKDTSHDIFIAVCRKSDDFPGHPDAVKTMVVSPAGRNSATVSFADIPYGKYAIMVFQDMNGNKKLDKGFLGIPKEPFAFSNNFRPLFGPPSWKDCEIEYSAASYTFQINGFIKM